MKFAHLIWSNLKRKKVRTLLTVLSVAVAFLLFGLLSSIKQALTGGVSIEGQNRLIVQHKGSLIQLLPVSYKERMERIARLMAQAREAAATPEEKARVALFERGQWEYLQAGRKAAGR